MAQIINLCAWIVDQNGQSWQLDLGEQQETEYTYGLADITSNKPLNSAISGLTILNTKRSNIALDHVHRVDSATSTRVYNALVDISGRKEEGLLYVDEISMNVRNEYAEINADFIYPNGPFLEQLDVNVCTVPLGQHVYTREEALNSWANTDDRFIYLPVNRGRWFSARYINEEESATDNILQPENGIAFNDILPSLRVKYIIDQFFTTIGYTLDSKFFNSLYFRDYLLPFVSPDIITSQDNIFINQILGENLDYLIGHEQGTNSTLFQEPITGDNTLGLSANFIDEEYNTSPYYQTTTGIYGPVPLDVLARIQVRGSFSNSQPTPTTAGQTSEWVLRMYKNDNQTPPNAATDTLMGLLRMSQDRDSGAITTSGNFNNFFTDIIINPNPSTSNYEFEVTVNEGSVELDEGCNYYLTLDMLVYETANPTNIFDPIPDNNSLLIVLDVNWNIFNRNKSREGDTYDLTRYLPCTYTMRALFNDLQAMFNLQFIVDERRKTVTIEPYTFLQNECKVLDITNIINCEDEIKRTTSETVQYRWQYKEDSKDYYVDQDTETDPFERPPFSYATYDETREEEFEIEEVELKLFAPTLHHRDLSASKEGPEYFVLNSTGYAYETTPLNGDTVEDEQRVPSILRTWPNFPDGTDLSLIDVFFEFTPRIVRFIGMHETQRIVFDGVQYPNPVAVTPTFKPIAEEETYFEVGYPYESPYFDRDDRFGVFDPATGTASGFGPKFTDEEVSLSIFWADYANQSQDVIELTGTFTDFGFSPIEYLRNICIVDLGYFGRTQITIREFIVDCTGLTKIKAVLRK